MTELFDIIVRFPDTRPALEDLKVSLPPAALCSLSASLGAAFFHVAD
jgi:hypothetical protein